MTALTAPAVAPRRSGPGRRLGRRLGSVIRLHFTNPSTLIVIPLIVLGSIFVLNIAIWVIVVLAVPTAHDRAQAEQGFGYSGSSAYVFVYMAIVAIQAMNGTFRFAQGFGATRRDYYLGTAIVFGILTAGYTAVLFVMGLLEQATHGWGLGGHMFTPIYFGTTWGDRLIVMVCLFLLCFFVGAALATVWVRWGRTGMLVFWGAVLLVLALVGLALSVFGGWAGFGAWLDADLPVGAALWSLVVTAVFGVAGYFILRGATPKG